MPLLSIADLNQPQSVIDPYIKMATDLGQMYFDNVLIDEGESYEYKVQNFAGKDRKPGIHASEMSKCMRLVVYSIMGYERKIDPTTVDVNMLMRFKVGKALHAMVQGEWHRIAARSQGRIRFEDEVLVSPHLGGVALLWELHSACDGIITFCDEALIPVLRVGLEIKTESEKQFDKIREPKDDHRKQTMLYMAALDVPLMWTLYYNKSNSNITTSYPPYLFRFDPKLWESLEMRFVKALHLAEIKSLPPREEGFECKWCAFAWDCKPPSLQQGGSTRPPISAGMLVRKKKP